MRVLIAIMKRKEAKKMKKFMVVCKSDGRQWACFYDDKEMAEVYRMSAVCGIGAEAEVYQYQDGTESECGRYEFLYS